MAFKVLAALLIVAVVAISAQLESECGPNEVYQECGLGDCQPSCGREGPVACTRMCVPGCYCKPGMLRSPIGCVPKVVCKQLLRAQAMAMPCGEFDPDCF